jgi:hypothetical protein
MKTLQYMGMKKFSMAIIIMHAPRQRALHENCKAIETFVDIQILCDYMSQFSPLYTSLHQILLQ